MATPVAAFETRMEVPAVPDDVSDGNTEAAEPAQGPPGIPAKPADVSMESAEYVDESARAEQPSGQQMFADERNKAIGKVIRSTAAGHNKRPKRRTSDAAAATAETGEEVVQLAASDWFRAAMASSLKVFGDHIETRFANMEARQHLTNWYVQGTITRVKALEQSTPEQTEVTHKNLQRHDESLQKVSNAKAEEMAQKAHNRIDDIEKYIQVLGRGVEFNRPAGTAGAAAATEAAAATPGAPALPATAKRQSPGPRRRPPESAPCSCGELGVGHGDGRVAEEGQRVVRCSQSRHVDGPGD